MSRSRRRTLVVGAAIGAVVIGLTVIGFLAVGLVTTESALSTTQSGLSTADSALSSADNAVAALTKKSAEQTTAERELRGVVVSQQRTIATFTSKGAAAVVAGQRKLIANFDALDFVIIDAISGNKVALQRDLRLLTGLLSPP